MLDYSSSERSCLGVFEAESVLCLKFTHEFWLIMIWNASVREARIMNIADSQLCRLFG